MNKNLILLATYTKLFMIVFQVLSNLIISDHDPEDHVFQYLRPNIEEASFFRVINYTLDGFLRWDAQHFMHIAKYGYCFEFSVAFFPFYPYLVRIITIILTFLLPSASIDTLLLLVFIVLNIVFSVLATNVLYKLTNLFFDKNVAYRTCVLFIFNPASIFFSAPYTESLFCYLTLESIHRCILILHKYSKPKKLFHLKDLSVLLFISISTGVRSNGVLNIGFLVYAILCIFFSHFPKTKTDQIIHTLKYICIIVTSSLICILPFVCFQVYCYQHFCTDFNADVPQEIIKYASDEDFILPGTFKSFNQSWCYSKIPLAYSHVQDKYWNVGFFKYYEFKQIPNFLLAFPCLYIVIKNCILHFNLTRKKIINIFNLDEIIVKGSKNNFFKLSLTVFVIHAFFLSMFCLLYVHVQVSTRMICSATPLFYWYCTYYWMNGRQKVIKYYFGTYIILGTFMFCNFLPWT